MWAYVDESGNTGNRIFDQKQPLFMTAALVTKGNFDLVFDAELKAIARKVGVTALHANELGVAKIELIAQDLSRVVKSAPTSMQVRILLFRGKRTGSGRSA